MNPYKDATEDNRVLVREFSESVDPEELKWHRDREDRTVEVVGESDWLFQADGQLPIVVHSSIFIPRGTWHRIIKGTGSLKVKITKH